MSARQLWYRTVYLKSDHWRDVRRRKLAQAPRCELCGNHQHLDIHHATYERIGNESLSDLVTLCRPCHTLQHRSISDVDKIRIERDIIRHAERNNLRIASLKQRGKPPHRRRHKRTQAFTEYAWHCLRMLRQGIANAQELEFIAKNQSAIARLRV